MMREVVIVSGARTPVGAFDGSLKSTPVVQLGALVLKETLKKAGLWLQAIACIRELQCNLDKTNPPGSGISIGHPIGCTGARIIVTLMGQMLRKGHALGLASLCIGGGQGMAMVLEHI